MNLEDNFLEAIKKLEEEGGKIVYVSDLSRSIVGQSFKIAIHQLVWYAVKLFVEVDRRLGKDDIVVHFNGLDHVERIDVSEHTALVQAEERVDQVRKCLLYGTPSDLVKYMRTIDVIRHRFFLKMRQGKKVLDNPDSYFVPGDHIQVERSNSSHLSRHRTGIYVGNRRVIYVVPDDENKEDALVVETDWETFHAGEFKFFICTSIFRLRSQEEIVNEAKKMIGKHTRKYAQLSRTFASMCQFGDEKTIIALFENSRVDALKKLEEAIEQQMQQTLPMSLNESNSNS